VRLDVGGLDPAGVPHRLLGEPAQVMTEGGRLRGLEVGAVGPHRRGVLAGQAGRRPGEDRDVGVQAEEPVPQREPERDPAGFPAGAAEVQPARRPAEGPLQLPLPAVVRVAVHRVVGELRRRGVQQVEQDGADGRRLLARHRAALGQLDKVSQVGEGQPAVEQRRVGDLQRVPGRHQLRRGPAGDARRGTQVALRRRPPCGARALPTRHGAPSRDPVNSVGAPPLTRNTWVPRTRPARHSAISAAMALAPNTGSRKMPSAAATSRAARAPSADAAPYPGPIQPPSTAGSARPAAMPPSAAAPAASARTRSRHSSTGLLTVTPTTSYGAAVSAAPASRPACVPHDPVASHRPDGRSPSAASCAASSTLARTYPSAPSGVAPPRGTGYGRRPAARSSAATWSMPASTETRSGSPVNRTSVPSQRCSRMLPSSAAPLP